MKVLISHSSANSNGLHDTWDQFVASIPGGHFEQTSRWAMARHYHGWESVIFMIEESKQPIAGTLIFYRPLPLAGKIGYASFGPCIKDNSVHSLRFLLNEIIHFFRRERYSYVVMNLSYYGQYMIPHFLKHGFHLKKDPLPPKGIMDTTLLLNLEKKTESLFAEMKKKTRYNIKKALQNGFTIREGTAQDIPLFYDLMLKTCKRRKVNPTPSGSNFYKHLWNSFNGTGWLRLSIVEYREKPVCAGLDFSFGNVYRAWKSGWTGEYAKMHPNEFLEWSTLSWAKLHGFKFYDFESIDRKVARELLSVNSYNPQKEEYENNPFYGPTIYKMGYGGEILELPGIYALFPNKIIHLLVSLFNTLIFNYSFIKNPLYGIWEKLKSKQK